MVTLESQVKYFMAPNSVNLLGTHTECQDCCMDPPLATKQGKNYRSPVEIISRAIWLYLRSCLSFRDVEGLLLERGVMVTYEAIRRWCCKFGQQYATRRRPVHWQRSGRTSGTIGESFRR